MQRKLSRSPRATTRNVMSYNTTVGSTIQWCPEASARSLNWHWRRIVRLHIHSRRWTLSSNKMKQFSNKTNAVKARKPVQISTRRGASDNSSMTSNINKKVFVARIQAVGKNQKVTLEILVRLNCKVRQRWVQSSSNFESDLAIIIADSLAPLK